jgi:hypothetical protein
MQHLLWIEVAFKGLAGLALILAPMSVLRLLGLHLPGQRYWPRMAGFLLFGIAAATAITLLVPAARGGLGPAGLVAINLSGASALLAPLVWGTAAPFRRGRLATLATGLALLALAFLEIAHI